MYFTTSSSIILSHNRMCNSYDINSSNRHHHRLNHNHNNNKNSYCSSRCCSITISNIILYVIMMMIILSSSTTTTITAWTTITTPTTTTTTRHPIVVDPTTKVIASRLCAHAGKILSSFLIRNKQIVTTTTTTQLYSSTTSSINSNNNMVATELPDSLSDGAVRAAEATILYVEQMTGQSIAQSFENVGGGIPIRCRIDFDTSIGDETYSILKTSTEFMQQYVNAISYAIIPNLQLNKQNELLRVIQAKQQLKELEENKDNSMTTEQREEKIDEYITIINNNGRSPETPYNGLYARIYFPDEGNAAYAKQNWVGTVPTGCVQYSSSGGIPIQDITKDAILFFFCPKASESNDIETIIQRIEMSEHHNVKVIVFINPNLVDMGVTGFGLTGRMLRERLINPLQYIYYLRTLSWGALTRQYPYMYSVYQEDVNAIGGYKLLENLNYLPSNPDVEDIYDIANGMKSPKSEGGGILDQFGDFVQGMMRL